MSTSDDEYYRARHLEELERARESTNPAVAAIHRKLAESYASNVQVKSINISFDDLVLAPVEQLAAGVGSFATSPARERP